MNVMKMKDSKHPLISIIVPLYNKVEYIQNTLNSIMAQTYKNYEVIVVNDGSTDGSERVVENMEDSRIKLINKNNEGVSSARNRGIDEATGEWLFFLDGDDTIEPCCLSSLIVLSNEFPNADICCGNFNVVYPGCKPRKYCKGTRNMIVSDNFKCFWRQIFFLCSGIFMIKKEKLNEVGRFDEYINVFEDYGLFLEMQRRCVIAYTPKVLFTYLKEASAGSRGISENKHFYDVRLDGTRGYERKVLALLLFREIITARKSRQFAYNVLKKNIRHFFFLIRMFPFCFNKIIKDSQVFDRIKFKVKLSVVN